MRILGPLCARTMGAPRAPSSTAAPPACTSLRREVVGFTIEEVVFFMERSCTVWLKGKGDGSWLRELRIACLDVIAPAAMGRDVLGAVERAGFAEKTVHAAAVFKLQRADRQRRGNQCDERAVVFDGHLPDLDRDARALLLVHAQQPRLGRHRARQGK